MYKLFQSIGLTTILLLIAVAVRAEVVTEIVETPDFGKLTIEHTDDEPKGIVLFASGASGWTADLTAIAREIADQDYVVAGIDLKVWLAQLDRAEATQVKVMELAAQ